MADKNKSQQYGVITEQGDLGLGFSALNNKTKKELDEAEKRKKDLEKKNNK